MAPDHSLRSLRSPNDAPDAQTLLGHWRTRHLTRLLVVAALLGSTTGAVCGCAQAAQGRWLLLAGNVTLVVLLWLAAGWRGLAGSTRITIALGALYGDGALSLATTGLSVESLLCFSGFVASATLLPEAHIARWNARLALGTVGAATVALASGLVAIPATPALVVEAPWGWLCRGLFIGGVLAGVGAGVRFLRREFATSLRDRTGLSEQLGAEAKERERAYAQLAQTQERLLHAHKLEVVGRLAGGIAHDFNNTLTVILSYGELIKSRLGRDHPASELADQIIQAAEQGGDLTKQLLTYTRRQIVKPRPVDVQQILRNAERALTRLVPRNIRIRRIESPEELYVTIDPTQLQQAILNLALNARDAMPNGGDLFLEATSCELRDPGELPLIRGHYVLIRVRDTGTGMGAETLARLFEPFFTTKEPGLGTGLGLANVRETTNAAGGHVAVKSELGTGSELTLYLPRGDARISGVEAAMPHSAPTRPRTVLVVDDEPQIREVIRTMLIDNRYLVRTAESARSALEILRNEHIDLVCTDLVMPEMSGSKLIDELKRSQPRLPVVVCSAYGTDDDVSRRVTRGEVLFLSKPFTRKELLDVVGRALASQPKQPNGRPLAAG